jgi:hypothetical protein
LQATDPRTKAVVTIHFIFNMFIWLLEGLDNHSTRLMASRCFERIPSFLALETE